MYYHFKKFSQALRKPTGLFSQDCNCESQWQYMTIHEHNSANAFSWKCHQLSIVPLCHYCHQLVLNLAFIECTCVCVFLQHLYFSLFFMRIITKVILLCGYKWYFKDLLLQLNWIFSSHLKTWKSFLDAFKWVGSNSNTMAQLRTGVTSMKKHLLNCVHVL